MSSCSCRVLPTPDLAGFTFVVWRQPDVVAAATPPPSPRVRPLNPLLRLQHHVRGMHHPWPCNRHEQRCSAQTFALMSLF